MKAHLYFNCPYRTRPRNRTLWGVGPASCWWHSPSGRTTPVHLDRSKESAHRWLYDPLHRTLRKFNPKHYYLLFLKKSISIEETETETEVHFYVCEFILLNLSSEIPETWICLLKFLKLFINLEFVFWNLWIFSEIRSQVARLTALSVAAVVCDAPFYTGAFPYFV